jgi:hypothetical protein
MVTMVNFFMCIFQMNLAWKQTSISTFYLGEYFASNLYVQGGHNFKYIKKLSETIKYRFLLLSAVTLMGVKTSIISAYIFMF